MTNENKKTEKQSFAFELLSELKKRKRKTYHCKYNSMNSIVSCNYRIDCEITGKKEDTL